MPTPTTRLALSKPFGPEPQDISGLNTNFDILDRTQGCILVNAGVTPPDDQLFDGAIVKEKVSGITWVAQWSGTAYVKKYISYPAFLSIRNTTGGGFGTGTLQLLNLGTTPTVSSNQNWNTGSGSYGATGARVPVDGIYLVTASVTWSGTNATGNRSLLIATNGTTVVSQAGNTVQTAPANTPNNTIMQNTCFLSLSAGDLVGPWGLHTAGVTLTYIDLYLQLSLISTK